MYDMFDEVCDEDLRKKIEGIQAGFREEKKKCFFEFQIALLTPIFDSPTHSILQFPLFDLLCRLSLSSFHLLSSLSTVPQLLP